MSEAVLDLQQGTCSGRLQLRANDALSLAITWE